MKIIRLWLLGAAVLGGASAQTNDKKTWIALDEQQPEGAPITLEVIQATEIGAEIAVKIPGFWIQPVEYGGSPFYGLLLPAVRISGVGYPKGPDDSGWWDFPADLKQVRRSPEAFERACDGSVRKSAFPESALDEKPGTAEEMERLGINPAGARPGLPRLRALFAVSRDNGPEDLELSIEVDLQQTKRVPLDLPVAPAGFEGSDAGEEGFTPLELIDREFYEKFEDVYEGPESLLDDVSGYGPFSGVQVAVPVFKLRTPKDLEIAPGFKIHLKHLKGTEDFECPLPWDHWLFTYPFVNGQAIRESLSAKGLKIEASRSAHYLIICPPDWRDTLDGFALWKQAKGLNVDFAYLGSDVAADRNAIDQYIEAFFKKNYCHGVYVLLCGDVGILPSGRSSRIFEGPDGTATDSDHAYEVLGNDRFPSAYVGRLSANTEEELKVQLDKILRYERNPVRGDWPTRVTLCANSQMSNGSYGVNAGWPTKYALAVEQTVNHGGYTNPPVFQTLHAGAASAAVVRAVNADVIAALNAGRGQVLYRGHGGNTSWVSGWDGSGTGSGTSFTSTHVNGLTNAVHPIVFSIACVNSRINQEDCIGERWMSVSGGGAVAHFGASVNSGTLENHERTKGIYRAIYEDGYTRLGPMLARAEQRSHLTAAGDYWDNNTFGYMLLGDPEMTIRRKAIPLLLPAGSLAGLLGSTGGGTTVSVIDAGKIKVPGAFVQITDEDGRRFNGFADVDGTFHFPQVDPGKVARLDLLADGFPFSAVYVKSPALEAVGFGEGGFKVRLLDAPQGIFRIYGSENLEDWDPLGLATPAGNHQEFVDPGATKPKRFYRAVQE